MYQDWVLGRGNSPLLHEEFICSWAAGSRFLRPVFLRKSTISQGGEVRKRNGLDGWAVSRFQNSRLFRLSELCATAGRDA